MGSKQLVERIGAIASIVINGLITIVTFIVIVNIDIILDVLNDAFAEEGVTDVVLPSRGMYISVMAVMIAFSVAAVTLGIMLLDSRRSKKFKLGAGIALSIINGLYAVLFACSGIYYLFIVSSGITVLNILGMALKDRGASSSAAGPSVTYMGPRDPYAGGGNIDPFDGTPVQNNRGYGRPTVYGTPLPDPFAESQPAEAQSARPKNETIDAKLADLKHLYEIGVLTEAQYREAVNKAVNDSLGIAAESKPDEAKTDEPKPEDGNTSFDSDKK